MALFEGLVKSVDAPVMSLACWKSRHIEERGLQAAFDHGCDRVLVDSRGNPRQAYVLEAEVGILQGCSYDDRNIWPHLLATLQIHAKILTLSALSDADLDINRVLLQGRSMITLRPSRKPCPCF